MSAIQEQTKKLKLNATNIKSVLVNKVKRLKRLRKIKARIVDVNLRQAKQAKVASKFGGGEGGGGFSGSPAMDILGFGAKLLAGMVKLGGLLLTGLILNNLPEIINNLKSAWDVIKPPILFIWNVQKTIYKSIWNFGKWVVSIFNPSKAKDNIDQIDENNKDLDKDIDELNSVIPTTELTLDEGEEGEEGDSGDESESSEAQETTKDEKPPITSTTPSSPSKSGEISKEGTTDQVVKDKPPIEETKKTSSPVLSGGNEEKSKQLKKLEVKKENLKKKIPRIKRPKVRQRKIQELKSIENRITSLKSDLSGLKITTISKAIDPVSLGKSKPNSPTIIVMPIKDTITKKVAVNVQSGGGFDNNIVSSNKTSRNRNSII